MNYTSFFYSMNAVDIFSYYFTRSSSMPGFIGRLTNHVFLRARGE